MRILLDVDGVVADFIGALFEDLKPSIKYEDVPEWDVFKHLTKDELTRTYDIISQPGFCTILNVMEHALEGVAYLRSLGEVIWVTAPNHLCPTWDHERRQWLKKHFGSSPKEVIFCDDKGLVKGDIFIDDKPENLRRWQEENPNGKAYLFEAPNNSHVDWPRRVNWADIKELIQLDE